jgi:hypothetical protein
LFAQNGRRLRRIHNDAILAGAFDGGNASRAIRKIRCVRHTEYLRFRASDEAADSPGNSHGVVAVVAVSCASVSGQLFI